MSYHHLTSDERSCLHEMLKRGKSLRQIADALGRAPSTISRELKRNSNKKGYHFYYAYSQAVYRLRISRCGQRRWSDEQTQYVIEKLSFFWSPEQIANRWNLEHSDCRLSVSTIYRRIKAGALPGITRKKNLRRRGKRKPGKRSKYNTIKPDRLIPDWPEEIVQRARYGDWEGDTIVGARGKGAAVTLVDRKSGLLRGWVIHSMNAEETRDAILSALKGLTVTSVSFDNGSEFSRFREVEEALHAPVFFAEPHKPWQRGCNENANDLLRFFFPKGCDFSLVSQDEFEQVLALINSRPRKRLAWLAPSDLFPPVALT